MGKKRSPSKLQVDVVEARSFVLVDESGNSRLTMSCSVGDGKTGGFTLVQIHDEKGNPAISIQVVEKEAGIMVEGNSGIRVSLAINKAGGGISIVDSQTGSSIQAGVPSPATIDPLGKSPRIVLIDVDGKTEVVGL